MSESETKAVVLPVQVVRHRESMAHALGIIDANPDVFQYKFRAWVHDNWHIWESFCTEADAVWSMGVRRYGSRTIIEYLRHSSTKREAFGHVKLNNDITPDVGRLYGLVYPTRQGFFECREMSAGAMRKRRRGARGRDDVDVLLHTEGVRESELYPLQGRGSDS